MVIVALQDDLLTSTRKPSLALIKAVLTDQPSAAPKAFKVYVLKFSGDMRAKSVREIGND